MPDQENGVLDRENPRAAGREDLETAKKNVVSPERGAVGRDDTPIRTLEWVLMG